MQKTTFQTVDEYIATFPKEVQQMLKKVRQTIKTAAPDAGEGISYNMPGYKLNRIVEFRVKENIERKTNYNIMF